SVSPGYVKTEILEANFKASGLSQPPDMKGLLDKFPSLQSEDVADSVLYVLATPRHVQVHELIIKPVGEPF
ncbi:hypothetical protein ILUMI_16260, partial [Ignelater luminosus]